MPGDESNIKREPLAQSVASAEQALKLRAIPPGLVRDGGGHFTPERQTIGDTSQ